MISISNVNCSNTNQLFSYRRIAVSESFQISSFTSVFKDLIVSNRIQVKSTMKSQLILIWMDGWMNEMGFMSDELTQWALAADATLGFKMI